VSRRLLVEHLREQAAFCAGHGSPLYGRLADALADDVEAGGPTAALLARWVRPSVDRLRLARDVPALRLLGGVHRLVLQRQAAELAPYYPSVGGSEPPSDETAKALLAVVDSRAAMLAPELDRPPQTNEVGRAVPLLGGLRWLSAWSGGAPVRLFEIGTSAGLLLRAEQLPVGPGRPVDAELPYPEAPPVRVVERVGGDPHPVDPTTGEGRLLLTSYVWADDRVRLERLRAALDVAGRVPAVLRAVDAGGLVTELRLEPGTTTVLWHSVMWQYVDDVERSLVLDALDRLGATATADARLAHLFFEPPQWPVDAFEVRVVTWPGGEDRVLGHAPAHGVPTTWSE
jgi:hypothetical protein